VYIPERNIVLCPMGQVLYPGFYGKAQGRAVFYNSRACADCASKCSKQGEGTGHRHPVRMAEGDFTKECNGGNLAVRQVRVKADKGKTDQRKSIVEHPFGTVKRAMDAGYCLTKGLRNVTGEFSLSFLAYNIKRAVNILGGTRLAAACGTK